MLAYRQIMSKFSEMELDQTSTLKIILEKHLGKELDQRSSLKSLFEYYLKKEVDDKHHKELIQHLEKNEISDTISLRSFILDPKVEKVLDPARFLKSLVTKHVREVVIDLTDVSSGELINIPVKMQDCNHLGVFDASTMAVGYVKTEVEGKSELQFPHDDCPAVINDLSDFEDLIMIDGFLMRALLAGSSRVIYSSANDCFYDMNRLPEYIQQNVISQSGDVIKINLTCLETKQRMKVSASCLFRMQASSMH